MSRSTQMFVIGLAVGIAAPKVWTMIQSAGGRS